jgi:Fe-S oxidoreductase
MAKMKIEVLAARAKKYGLSLRDRFVGYLPRYAPLAAKLPWLMNLRDILPGAAKLSEAIAGLSARRTLPKWRRDIFVEPSDSLPRKGGGEESCEVVLFADTFNRYFERENLDAAYKVLAAAGYKVHCVKPADGSKRPLCCGRTFFSVGRVDEARKEAERTLKALLPFAERGVAIVGLEPSCILGFRDEIPSLLKNDAARKLAAHALTFEEFLLREAKAGRLELPLKETKRRALVHGHCHQKAFDAFSPVMGVLKLVPGLDVQPIESSCCGMAGAFGFQAETIDVSLAMGELSLLPAVRKASAGDIIVADGTSCRHQIHDGAARDALHVARVLADQLP